MINRARMLDQLQLHEGFRAKPYKDTEDFWTVGIGYNLSARGVDFLNDTLRTHFDDILGVTLTLAQAQQVATQDLIRVEKAVRTYLTPAVYDALAEPRQRVCVDMAFNMGWTAARFQQTIKAVKASDWSAAAREMWDSKWAGQVGDGPGKKKDRADRLTQMLLTGRDYTS